MIPPTIGYPERWDAFNKRHRTFVSDCYPELVRTSEKILNRHISINSIEDDVIYLLGRTSFEDYCELWVLAGNGYGVGALKILRGLYEKVVTLGYLVQHQSEIQRFCDYGLVQKRRLVRRMKEHSATRGLLPSEIYEKIEEDYERVKDQFLDTKGRSLSWTLLDTYSLAKQAGHDLDIVSVNAYVMPNLHIHASTTDLNRKVPQGDGTYKFDNGPQEQHADSALLSATHLLIVALYLQEDYFQLGIRPQIDAVQLGFANSWSEG